MPLAKLVLSRLRKLGATLPMRWDEPVEVAGQPLAEPLRQLAKVTFPATASFCTSEEDTPWLWDLGLGGVSDIDAEELGLEWDGGPLACIGGADGGNNLLLIRLDDDKPADPNVYDVDHSDPGQTLGKGVRLSKLLGMLRVEAVKPPKPDTGLPLSQPFRGPLSIAFNKTQDFSREDLARVRSISLTQSADLNDLQYFPNLENLQLLHCTLTDLDALRHVPKLLRLFVIESSVGDWSSVRTHGALKELHTPACGLSELTFFPDHLNAATVTANPLGLSASADLARLPRAMSHLPHPDADELELNDALRSRGVQACCATWEQQRHIVQTPGAWRKLDPAGLRSALDSGAQVMEWINAIPATRSPQWHWEWTHLLNPALHP